MQLGDLVTRIDARRAERGHPIVVGVSGFGGSGKSTLARAIVAARPDWIRLRGDDFLDPARSHRRSPDWDGVERGRLADEVLIPFRRGEPGTFRRYDWARRELGAPEPVPRGDVLVVDLIGLFHPDVLEVIDLTIWCDVGLATATARGIARDHDLGRDHTRLWHEVWVPNERDFADRYDPRGHAELHHPSGAQVAIEPG